MKVDEYIARKQRLKRSKRRERQLKPWRPVFEAMNDPATRAASQQTADKHDAYMDGLCRTLKCPPWQSLKALLARKDPR